MAGEGWGAYWGDPRIMEPKMSSDERALKDLFVQQYIIDYNEYNAALRMGLAPSVAATYCKQLLDDGYVQREIVRLRREEQIDEKAQRAQDRELAFATLRKVMEIGSPAAMVAATRVMADMHGFNAPIKTQNEHSHRGGVMMVPAIADIEEWEKAAAASQEKLVEAAQKQ